MKRFLILFMLALFSSSSWAEEPLVTMKAWLKPSESGYKVNEQIILYVELATPRWFTSGTRISLPEIPNVLVKQQSQLATNYTQRIKAQTWSTQRWEIALYPQSSGKYVIPPMAVEFQVSSEKSGKVKNTLFTEALRFEATLPSGLLTEESEWVNSPEVTLSQDWSASNDALSVGDSVTRTIRIEAKDTLSVLIPSVLSEANGHQERYQAYPSAPILDDMQNRGTWRAVREEKVTYVLQAGGELVLPELKLSWWDSKTQQLVTLSAEGQTFEVKHTFSSWLKQYRFVIIVTASLIYLALVLVWMLIRHYRVNPSPRWWQFHKAVMSQHKPQIRTQLYARLKRSEHLLQMRQKDIPLEKYCSGYVKPWILWIKLSQVAGFSMLYNRRVLPQLARISQKYRGEK